METRFQINSILSQILNIETEELNKLDVNDDLIGVGLTSIKAISLVTMIEQSYNIVLEDEEFFFENLNTIAKIERLISKYNPTLA